MASCSSSEEPCGGDGDRGAGLARSDGGDRGARDRRFFSFEMPRLLPPAANVRFRDANRRPEWPIRVMRAGWARMSGF